MCFQVAAERARKVFSLKTDCEEELLQVMLDWALGGFKPSGPNGLLPRSRKDGKQLYKKKNTTLFS